MSRLVTISAKTAWRAYHALQRKLEEEHYHPDAAAAAELYAALNLPATPSPARLQSNAEIVGIAGWNRGAANVLSAIDSLTRGRPYPPPTANVQRPCDSEEP